MTKVEETKQLERPDISSGSVIKSAPTIRFTDSRGDHAVIIERAMTLGSADDVDVVVKEPTVSRIHCSLEPREDGLWVQDLGSRNGTFIGDVRVSAARIPGGGALQVGGVRIGLDKELSNVTIPLWHEGRLGEMRGESVPMRALFASIVRVAASDATVLIQGETGAGKELVARAIHDASSRARREFVVIDCAALPEALLEAELFGHVKGAFTGADQLRRGAIETAEGGTIFLDEVAELPLSMQPKLLRVLESKTVRRVGESAHRKVDVRFVAATHRDLRAMVNDGAFREDLYFRLGVIPLRVPPLRDRRDDIPALVRRFAPSLPDDVVRKIEAHVALTRLSGNVRELRNLVERAVVLGVDRAFELPVDEDASPLGDASNGLEKPFHDFQRDSEREYVRALLLRHSGNVQAAANAAGLNRTYLYRLIRKHSV